MSDNFSYSDNSVDATTAAEEAGLSPTPTSGLSSEGTATESLYSGLKDPNAAALDENADAAKRRQLTGEPPGSEGAADPDGLPATQSEEFEDGT